ncbi:MAG TPA: hypothetical protein VGV37_03245 [Aliidongia sp.]|uniref:hypothetical protein n=1 Tax=Aliidongia sp. TaxID=1914230 RepID=UPI002DDCB775|nr:hypothetical protein [Aliidongia sp.]HEV2673530.1 hypothetical protein [Aliidongia sp.]
MVAETPRRHRTWTRKIANIVIFGTIAGILSACYVYPVPPPHPHYYYYGGYYR